MRTMSFSEVKEIMTRRRVSVRKPDVLILIITLISLILYCIAISMTYNELYTIRETDPLAVIHALNPAFYLIIALLSLLSCIYFLAVHRVQVLVFTILMMSFAFVLLYTPYYLSDFLRLPDTLRNLGIAKFITHTLNGYANPTIYSYGKDYPLSFIFGFIFVSITSVNIFVYGGTLYPFFSLLTILLLWYTFLSKLASREIAFISIMFAVPSLIYIELHPSPHTLGMLLVLSSLILLFRDEGKSMFIKGLLFTSLILSHPVSPLILLIFIITKHAMMYVYGKDLRVLSLLEMLYPISLWLSWSLYNALGVANQTFSALINVITLRFINEINIEQIAPTSMYTEIKLLRTFIYCVYIFLFSLILLKNILQSSILLKLRKSVERRRTGYESFTISKVYLFGVIILLSLLTIIISFPMKWKPTHRILNYIFLLISSYCWMEMFKLKNQRHVMTILTILFIVISILYPVASYSSESYLSITSSEKLCILFLAQHAILDSKTVSMHRITKLAPFIVPSTNFVYLQFPPNLSTLKPDIIVFSSSAYFEIALTKDLSLTDNSYLHALSLASVLYNKIYSNGMSSIFTKP